MESHGFRISGLWLASLSGIEEREDEVIIETFRRALHWFVGCVSGSFFHHEFYEKPICDSLVKVYVPEFLRYVYTLDYELPSDKGAAKLPDEHPDLKQEQSPSAKETEDLEGGRRSSSTDEGRGERSRWQLRFKLGDKYRKQLNFCR